MMNRGKLAVLAIFCLAAMMGGIAWWSRFAQGERILKLWPDHASLINDAPEVTLLALQPVDDSERDPHDPPLTILSEDWRILKQVDLAGAAGLLHARHALVQDTSYTWEITPAPKPHWDFVLQFRDPPRQASLAFDLNASQVCLVETGAAVTMKAFLARAMRKKFDDWRSFRPMPAKEGSF